MPYSIAKILVIWDEVEVHYVYYIMISRDYEFLVEEELVCKVDYNYYFQPQGLALLC